MTLVTWSDGDYDASNTFYAKEIPAKRWNGAAMPWFSEAEASRIADDQATSNAWSSDQFRWNISAGTFEVQVELEDGVFSWAEVTSKVDAEGIKLYQMGDGWTWHEITAPDPEDVDPEAEDAYRELESNVDRAILAHHGNSVHYYQTVVGK